MRLLADVLAVNVRQVRIVSGHASPNKVVEIDGLSPALAQAALAVRCARASE